MSARHAQHVCLRWWMPGTWAEYSIQGASIALAPLLWGKHPTEALSLLHGFYLAREMVSTFIDVGKLVGRISGVYNYVYITIS